MSVYSNLVWKGRNGDELYLGSKLVASLIPSELHSENMFRIKFADGNVSADFYNRTMAKENAKTIVSSELDRRPPGATEKLTGAFK